MMPPSSQLRLAFVAAATPEARSAYARLSRLYGTVPLDQADAVVTLGGDGCLLEALHRSLAAVPDRPPPVYGLNLGSVGFLLNPYDREAVERNGELLARVARAQQVALHPLRMVVTTAGGRQREALAVNEVSLFRQTRQTAKLRVTIDGVERLPELICDGVLVSTAAGSTAYNLSVHGPILPLGSEILALTPISAFRPRRWRGALLRHDARIIVEVLEPEKRPVSAVADSTEVRDTVRVEVAEDRSVTLTLLFDPECNLEERILVEQFQQ
ncbi:NAD kinase [uncultured Gammaproteobacteria bacterium]